MYIIVEGIDTAGKSTQIELLKEHFPEAIFTKEPGATKLGKTIRQLVLNTEAKSQLAEMFLFLADRAEHSFEVLQKAQQNNKIVISDRGFISGVAYANLPIQQSLELNIMALDKVMANKIVILTLDEDELKKRLSNKSQDNIEKRGIQYLLQIQNKMIETAKMLNQISTTKVDLLILDASSSIEAINKEIIKFINT